MTIYQVVHKQRLYLQEVRNVYYYLTSSGNPTTDEWQDISDEIRADYVAYPILSFVSDWEFYAIDYRIVDTAGLLAFESIPSLGNLVGTSVIDGVASQVACLVSVKGTTTKPNRARTYLCGFHEDNLTDSLWTSGMRGVAEVFIDLQSVLNAGGTNPLVRVAAQWNSTHTQVIAHNNISGSAAQASIVPATQRRRRIGVGI